MSHGPAGGFSGASSPRRIGLLSTYPPKLCGLATFAAALEAELTRAGEQVDVVRVDDGDPVVGARRPTAGALCNGNAASVREAAALLSRGDVAIVQHEFGIFGGADGSEVIDVLEALETPAVVVLHTVPLTPTPNQRAVLERVCELACRLVVMSEAAGVRLLASYEVDPARVVTIPHGASSPERPGPGALDWAAERPQLLTWGLLGPGKGIEHAIDALALLEDVRPAVRYTVAGVTHPKVHARHGDAYRNSLMRRAQAAGVAGSVAFDDTYRDVPTLTRLVAASSLVILPYDSRDQVTSGVLVDAIAAGRPVIATRFPHAVELLSSGAGLLVPHGDPLALAAAIRRAVTVPGRLEAMAAAARRLAPTMRWSAVAARYRHLCDEVVLTDGVAAR